MTWEEQKAREIIVKVIGPSRTSPNERRAFAGAVAQALKEARNREREHVLRVLNEVTQYTLHGQVYMLQKDWLESKLKDSP